MIVYNYSCVLCHYIAMVTEFLDGWSEGWSEGDGAEMLESVLNAFLRWLTDVPNMLLRHFVCNSS